MIKLALGAIVDRLIAAGCVDAAAEAAEILAAAPRRAHARGVALPAEQGEPLAWITSTVLFCGQSLHVAPGVYVPRVQTEELARRWLLIEVGGDQDEVLAPTLAASGFDLVTPWCDDDGDLRGVASQVTGSGTWQGATSAGLSQPLVSV